MAASITLTSVQLNLASDLSQYRLFPSMSALRVTTAPSGEVRAYANGRRRLIRKVGVPRSLVLTLPNCSRDQISWLETNAGQLMLIRDHTGRKIWGVYMAAPVDENPYNADGLVTLTLNEVTHSEVIP